MPESPPYRKEHELDLSSAQRALERPLALVDSPERRADMQRFVEAAGVHLERAIQDLLSVVVDAVNEARGNVTASLQYSAAALRLVVEASADAESAGDGNETDPPIFTSDGDMEKVTIRIPAELKDLITQAASLRGLSVNSWYVRELARNVTRATREQFREEHRHGPRGRDQDFRWGPPEQRPQRESRSLRGFVGDD